MTEPEKLASGHIPAEQAGARLDKALAMLFPDYSRSVIQQWIKDGRVSLDGVAQNQRHKVRGGEAVAIALPEPRSLAAAPQAIALDVVYEDDALLVINKPPGLVVHPGAGNPDLTLLNALLARDPDLTAVARAGIVHRLDKETSGLLVVARNEQVRRHLAAQLEQRTLKRRYLAIVCGVLISGGRIEAPIGRHATDRTRMAVTARGRPAVSHYRVVARYRAHTLVEVSLETGRTHQIRVHLAHRGFPIVGDPVYGGRLKIPAGASPELAVALHGFRRQALHATGLGLEHPVTGAHMEWERPPPADMQRLIDVLAADKQASERDTG